MVPDICKVVITPDADDPDPEHPYLRSRPNERGEYHYYFVHYDPDHPNPVPEDANWRYGAQAEEIWGENASVEITRKRD